MIWGVGRPYPLWFQPRFALGLDALLTLFTVSMSALAAISCFTMAEDP